MGVSITSTEPAATPANANPDEPWPHSGRLPAAQREGRMSPGAPMQYTEFIVANANGPSVGMMAKPPYLPPDMPSFWLPYFMVTDVDATAAKAKAGGAQIHFGPQDLPGTGRFAVIADPQGAAFALFAPRKA